MLHSCKPGQGGAISERAGPWEHSKQDFPESRGTVLEHFASITRGPGRSRWDAAARALGNNHSGAISASALLASRSIAAGMMLAAR